MRSPKKIGIYSITSPTGKVYIGQSRNLVSRKNAYKNGHCKKQWRIYNSLMKHSWERHKFKVLHFLPPDVEQKILDTYEQLYMDLYRACRVELLNIKEAGSFGKHSAETVKKMSERQKGKKGSPQMREKLRKANIGRKNSGMFGKTHSPETRVKMHNKKVGYTPWNKGKTTPEEII